MSDPAPANPAAPEVDVLIIGAGAAGLMAAVFAGRAAAKAHAPLRVLAVDGAKKLGAKVLVAGGGRCNVTHHAVDASAYAGSSRNAIRKVLGRFDVPQTVAFFEQLGVTLKREETGKLFPTTDDAHTVLNALLAAVEQSGARLLHPWRVSGVEATADGGFLVHGPDDSTAGPPAIRTRRLILATGGMALPKTGSDGAGYRFAKALGHSVTPLVTPALVPLTLADGCFIRELSGLTLNTTLTLHAGGGGMSGGGMSGAGMSGAGTSAGGSGALGKPLVSFTNSTLCTHFGLSGPAVLDISRYYLDTLAHDPQARLVLNWLPGVTAAQADAHLLARRNASVLRVLTDAPWSLPERLARAILAQVGLSPGQTGEHVSKDTRRALVTHLCACPLPVTGNRGYTYAEVTAGGVPLSELHLESMASRVCPGLHIIGELCDVDGRIGGFNFQWAWATGYVAGNAAVADLLSPQPASA
ncbi:MAG: NAD(P)/FAD-dependent oxidoreductase [Planctomycetaceae bacterium]|nr:NAD(P)/FAD-dependent oxidoreductase [Planctomycetaceae bacterium]